MRNSAGKMTLLLLLAFGACAVLMSCTKAASGRPASDPGAASGAADPARSEPSIVEAAPDVNNVDPETAGSEYAAPADVVRQFYSWYIKAGYPEPTTHKTQFRRFVTQACLRKAINADDYVYFTQAQDGDPSWGTHIAVTISSNNGQKALASITLGKPSATNKLKVELVKEGGVWKINNVDSVS